MMISFFLLCSKQKREKGGVPGAKRKGYTKSHTPERACPFVHSQDTEDPHEVKFMSVHLCQVSLPRTAGRADRQEEERSGLQLGVAAAPSPKGPEVFKN